jgi:hypothetical protein
MQYHRQIPRAAIVVVLAILALGVASPAMAATQSATCRPGSGPDLAGKTITSSQASGFSSTSLACANLTDSNLSGLSLGQVNFTDANLSGADLRNADLTQATLDGANLSGADLAGATLDQASARGTDFRGANMSGTSLVQTDLTSANLDDTSLGGASFGQATFDDTTFTGATGLTPWSLYLLIAAIAIFVLLAARVLAQARRSGGRVALSLVGCLVFAFGFHLLAGGIINEFIGQMNGDPVTQTCTGPQCAVGVDSGLIGVFGGIIVLLIGASLIRRRAARPVSLGEAQGAATP